jgi:hypothetical protein
MIRTLRLALRLSPDIVSVTQNKHYKPFSQLAERLP